MLPHQKCLPLMSKQLEGHVSMNAHALISLGFGHFIQKNIPKILIFMGLANQEQIIPFRLRFFVLTNVNLVIAQN